MRCDKIEASEICRNRITILLTPACFFNKIQNQAVFGIILFCSGVEQDSQHDCLFLGWSATSRGSEDSSAAEFSAVRRY